MASQLGGLEIVNTTRDKSNDYDDYIVTTNDGIKWLFDNEGNKLGIDAKTNKGREDGEINIGPTQ